MIFADRTFVEVKADLIHSILTVRVFLSVALRHCAKSVRIWSFSGPYFPVFRLNT